MRHPSCPVLCLLATILPPLRAQERVVTAVPIDRAIVGLQPGDDGNPLGLGADYQVRFLADRFEFKPVLGRVAPHDLPFTLQVTEVGRGRLAPVGPARREERSLRVDYVRPELVERLDIRSDGLEQSFVFDRLPAGDGDLVVRARFTTELRPGERDAAGGLSFTWPGAGGLRIAPVVGIAADGARCAGDLRVRGEELEFVLPAAFVATARLPLVLDPLVAPVVTVASNAADENQVDAARLDLASPRTAVVYVRTISATNTDVYATFVDDSGSVGTTVVAESSTTVSGDSPRVAASDIAGRWLVCWNTGSDVQGRVLLQNQLGASVAIATTSATETGVTICGGSRGGSSRVLVAWLDDTGDALLARTVDLAGATPAVGTAVTLVTDAALLTQLGAPTLPPTSDTAAALLTYTLTGTLLNTRTVRAVELTGATTPALVGSGFPISTLAGTNAQASVVAGNGREWVVAYLTSNSVAGPGAVCVGVRREGGTLITAPRELVPLGTAVSQLDAAWAGDSAWIGLTRGSGTNHDILLVSVDPLTCGDCEGLLFVDLSGNGGDVGVTATSSGKGAIVWSPIVSGQGNVALERFTASDGTITALGSGTFGAHLVSTCARIGRTDFGIELHGAVPSVPTFALLAGTRLDAPCSGGVIVPDLFTGFVVTAGTTGATGDLRLQFAIPNTSQLASTSLFAQFVTFGTSCFGVVDVSPALQITLN